MIQHHYLITVVINCNYEAVADELNGINKKMLKCY